MRVVRSMWIATALVSGLALAGCTGPATVTCTEIGAAAGIAVTVQRDLAPTLRDLVLTVCVDKDCSDHPVSLTPGSTAVPGECPTPAGPDTTCSASASPDGTAVGFVEISDLPARSLTVSATAKLDANALTLAAQPVTSRPTFPNGTSCPPGGNQVAISLSGSGIR